MFSYDGKTTRVIGKKNISIYRDLYEYLTAAIDSESLPSEFNYLGDSELAKNIYRKKYYLKDLNNKLIETRPEDVFKRVAAFMAVNEGTRGKQRKWAD